MTTYKKEQRIPVLLVNREEYAPEWSKRVGRITQAQMNEFLRFLAKTPRNAEYCISSSACAKYNCSATVTLGENTLTPGKRCKNYVKSGVLEISNLFWHNNELHCLKRNHSLCSEQNKINACAYSMCSGNCVDPVMRKLAAIMFPQKYKDQR